MGDGPLAVAGDHEVGDEAERLEEADGGRGVVVGEGRPDRGCGSRVHGGRPAPTTAPVLDGGEPSAIQVVGAQPAKACHSRTRCDSSA